MVFVADYEIGEIKLPMNGNTFKRLKAWIKNFTGCDISYHSNEQEGWGTVILDGSVEIEKSRFVCGMVYAYCLERGTNVQMNYLPLED